MTKRTLLVLLIAVLALPFAGCGPGGGTSPGGGKGPGGGAPGPIITLGPASSSSPTLDWVVDSTTQSPSVPGTSIYPNCELRRDFIGLKTLVFNYYETETSAPQPAKHVIVSSEGHTIDIRLDSNGHLKWTLLERTLNSPDVCGDPAQQFPHVAGELPDEFFNLKSDELLEKNLNLPIYKIEIQVEVPKPPNSEA